MNEPSVESCFSCINYISLSISSPLKSELTFPVYSLKNLFFILSSQQGLLFQYFLCFKFAHHWSSHRNHETSSKHSKHIRTYLLNNNLNNDHPNAERVFSCEQILRSSIQLYILLRTWKLLIELSQNLWIQKWIQQSTWQKTFQLWKKVWKHSIICAFSICSGNLVLGVDLDWRFPLLNMNFGKRIL